MVCSVLEGSGCVTVGLGRVGVVVRVGYGWRVVVVVGVLGRDVLVTVVGVRVGVLAVVVVVGLAERLVVVGPNVDKPEVIVGMPTPAEADSIL